MFGSHQKILGKVTRQFLETTSLQDKNIMHLSQKKLAGIGWLEYGFNSTQVWNPLEKYPSLSL